MWDAQSPSVNANHSSRLRRGNVAVVVNLSSWNILEVGVLNMSRLEKRMVVVRCRRKPTIKHLVGNGRGVLILWGLS